MKTTMTRRSIMNVALLLPPLAVTILMLALPLHLSGDDGTITRARLDAAVRIAGAVGTFVVIPLQLYWLRRRAAHWLGSERNRRAMRRAALGRVMLGRIKGQLTWRRAGGRVADSSSDVSPPPPSSSPQSAVRQVSVSPPASPPELEARVLPPAQIQLQLQEQRRFTAFHHCAFAIADGSASATNKPDPGQPDPEPEPN